MKRALGLEGGVPVPENVFGESVLECSHPGHGVRFEFRAEDALAGWHANQQKRLGELPCELTCPLWNDRAHVCVVLPGRTVSKSEFDWTFSTPYNGSIHLDKAGHARPASRVQFYGHEMVSAETTCGFPVLREKLRAARRIEAPEYGVPVRLISLPLCCSPIVAILF